MTISLKEDIYKEKAALKDMKSSNAKKEASIRGGLFVVIKIKGHNKTVKREEDET